MTGGSERAWEVLRWIDNPHRAMIWCPFPLETGEMTRLRLPTDLLPIERDRMIELVKAWTL